MSSSRTSRCTDKLRAQTVGRGKDANVKDHFGRVYDSMASSYADHAADGPYNAHYDRPSMLELCGDVAGKRVLDAACGPGFYAAALGIDARPLARRLREAAA